MEPLYNPDGVEERWQQTWEAEGLYNAEADDPRESFALAHPPPNVTGDLHLGHALQLSLADTLVRTRRMQGYNVLFQPGYDHAGISTQNAVEKHLAEEGKTRQDLGREAFEARVWEWLHEYGGKIMVQFRRIGASLDYRRERFTMDDAYVRAVMRFFVHLWNKGWIYRANRIVNWCPFHLTSLSDLELAHVEADDPLAYVRYPLVDGEGHITIATVRPATILADVAVAVHPADERYRELVGREVVVPFVERRVPVIADERVERDFATGALKVTPGHDPLDYEIGRDHGLPELTAIGPDGTMNAEAGAPEGPTQAEADERTLGWPDDTADLRAFYPGSLNTTARDIIRLWENRMIFAGLELMGDVPFEDVVIHSLVHAPSGGRMSKSLGTGMNPLALIERHGADATRYGLMKMASAQDVRFSEGAIEEGRKLANKLWNASRLLLQAGVTEVDERPASLEERWILARLSQVQRSIEARLAEFDFTHLVAELYHLTFDDFCDWYLEAIKPRIYGGDTDALATAAAALERLLKLLHPVLPHVTEEIWSYLPDRESRLIVTPWPAAGDESSAGALTRVQEA